MIELIPAIDLINGKCVRLTKGDYEQKKVYHENPVEVASEFERLGFERLHVVDLDGAKSQHIVNIDVLREITTKTSLKVDFGGGIKTNDDIEKAFANGASMVTVGSIAVKHPDLFLEWLDEYGAERMILGADVRNGMISVNGWKEDSTERLLPFLRKYIIKGVKNVLCTEISKDGTLTGPAIGLYQEACQVRHGIPDPFGCFRPPGLHPLVQRIGGVQALLHGLGKINAQHELYAKGPQQPGEPAHLRQEIVQQMLGGRMHVHVVDA